MTNEKTLTATNKILVGNDLIEEYLFDETKKAELEKGLQNLVNNLREMIEDEDANLSTIYNGYGRTIVLDTEAVYDMIDDMYLSLPWEAPRWGKATDRTNKCFAYGKEREILAREVALKLGAYNCVVLINLGTDDIKEIDFNTWYSLPAEQRESIILETEHDYIYPDNIFIPEEITEVEEVENVENVETAEQITFDIDALIEDAKVEKHIQENIACDRILYIDELEDLKNDIKNTWIYQYIIKAWADVPDEELPIPRVNINTIIGSLRGTALAYLDGFREPRQIKTINLKALIYGALSFIENEKVRYLAAYAVLTSIGFDLYNVPTNVTAINVIDSEFNVVVKF